MSNAALAVEAARKDVQGAQAMTDSIVRYVSFFREMLETQTGTEARKDELRSEAVADVATMVGGVIPSRVAAGANARMSREILMVVRDWLGDKIAK